MKQKVKKIIKHPIVYGSAIVVFGNLLANFFNFLFNLFMSRSLSVTDYGVLASILSLISFPALLANAINPVVVRFAGDYFVRGELDLVKGLYIKLSKFFLLIGTAFSIIYFLNINNISNFFHIDNIQILVFAGVIMFIYLIGIINLAFLQAKLSFTFLVFLSFLSAVVKLILGIIFVVTGFAITGATAALVLSSFSAFITSFYPLKFILKRRTITPEVNSKELFKYGIPSALTLIGLTSFLSADILLAKHLFNPNDAGLYAGLSLIGRIIFFITVPIGSVMFPIVVQKHSKGEDFSSTFKLSMLFVLIPSIVMTTLYFIYPEYAILFFLKKTEYLAIAPYLGLFGIYITLYCILYLMSTFYLSIKKTNVYFPILVGAILQIALIYRYHETFQQVVINSFVLILLLVISFLLYYPYATKK